MEKFIVEDQSLVASLKGLKAIVNQVIYLQFRKEDKPITATVRGIHFYRDKTKYDLGLWLGDGSVDDPERETRIYNVDSEFVTPS
jgi:DNA-binding transcriptional regulator WhiA